MSCAWASLLTGSVSFAIWFMIIAIPCSHSRILVYITSYQFWVHLAHFLSTITFTGIHIIQKLRIQFKVISVIVQFKVISVIVRGNGNLCNTLSDLYTG